MSVSDVITQAAEAAGLPTTDDGAGAESTVETSTEVVTDGGEETPVVEGAEAVVEEGTEAATVEAKAEEKPTTEGLAEEDLEKILLEYGITPTKPGQKEGHYSRSKFRKVLGKELLRVRGELEKKGQEKITAAEGRLKTLQPLMELEPLIASDPNRYLQALARAYPQHYQKFLTPPAPVAAVAPVDLGPKPEPDYKFDDGSMGYTPAQHEKLLKWQVGQETAALKKQLDERLKPYDDERKAMQTRAENMPRVEAAMKTAVSLYGKLFTDDIGDVSKPNPNSEISQFMRTHPDVPFIGALQQVYIPKMIAAFEAERQEFNKKLQNQRVSILEEMKKAPRKASTVGAGTGAVAESTSPQSVNDIVRAAAREAGLL